MPEVVEPDRPQPGLCHQRPEPLRHSIERERVAVLAGEDQAVIDVRDPPIVALGLLVHLVAEQDASRAAVQLHPAGVAAGGLQRAEHHAAVQVRAVRALGQLLVGQVDLNELLPHDQDTRSQVHIVPAKADRLTAAKAGRGNQLEQRAEPNVGNRVVEEGAQLLGLPRAHLRP